jgi:formylglycine-generating enzyme required for sulfatase activity
MAGTDGRPHPASGLTRPAYVGSLLYTTHAQQGPRTAKLTVTRHLAAAVLALSCLWLGAPVPATAAPQPFPAPIGADFRDCPDCPRMVVLPLGEFMMGSPLTERHRFDNEGPQHRVRVTRPIAMAMYPVTAGELANWTGRPSAPGGEDFPAVMVSWVEATQYAAWLSHKTGHTYRLPTEAEYEYAERAGTTSPYYWGQTIGKGNANCIGCGSAVDGTGSTKVGSFPPNAFGLFDTAGDAFEWVEDCYVETYDGAPTEAHIARQSPDGACQMRGLRASSWFNLPSFLRSAYRFREVPTGKSSRRSFRLVREADAGS